MPERAPRTVLIVDDDADLLRASALLLRRSGFEVTTAPSAEAALELLRTQRFHVVLSDLVMDGLNGMDLLRLIRARDVDTPVILMTGGPSLDTAIEAMAVGAYRYLLKPVAMEVLLEAVTRAALLSEMGRLKREALALQHQPSHVLDDREELDGRFSSALDNLAMAFQPIVSISQRRIVGQEALVRTDEPSMRNPAVLFDTASLLGRQSALSTAIYSDIAQRAKDIPDDQAIFVNVHPPDLLDESLHGHGSALAPFATRIVLEITERASIDAMGDISVLTGDLRRLGYRLAIDDLGTGYAGLTSFTQLSPDVAKLDRSLVTAIDKDPTKQRVVRAMLALCTDLGITAIAEGVETAGERDTLVELGADWLQGYFFAKPSRDIQNVAF